MDRINLKKRLELTDTDPITEYIKISDFIKNSFVYDYLTIEGFFKQIFKYLTIYSGQFNNLDDIIIEVTERLDNVISNNSLTTLSRKKSRKDFCSNDILNDYLDYCELMLNLYNECFKYIKSYFDKQILLQGILIIKNGLKKLGYEIYYDDDKNIVIGKENIVAEIIIQEAEKNISKLIIEYMTIRDEDIEMKEKVLVAIADLIEADIDTMKKELKTTRLNKIGEYIQILRHKGLNIEKKKYLWFFEKEEKYIDYIFNMILFVLYFKEVKKEINEFVLLGQ